MKKIILILLALGAVGLVGYRIVDASNKRSNTSPTVLEAPLVRTAAVQLADVDNTVMLTGSIKASQEVQVFTKLGGRVDSVKVKVGDVVRANQVLASVEHKEISWQAKQAEAGVAAARAGRDVAAVGRDSAKIDFERTKKLSEGGAAAAAQLEGAELKMRMSEAQYLAAEAQLAQAIAASGLAQQQVQNARIESPIDGVVTFRGVEVGSMAGQQLVAFKVQNVDTLKLETSVDLATYSKLSKGMKVEVTVDDLPGEVFTGVVDTLSPTLDAQTRRAAVEITIDNSKGRLLPYAFARAAVRLGSLASATVVPVEAVLQTGEGAQIYRIKDGVVEVVKATLGPKVEGRVAVLQGLDEGDTVAVGGLGQLIEGGSVRTSP